MTGYRADYGGGSARRGDRPRPHGQGSRVWHLGRYMRDRGAILVASAAFEPDSRARLRSGVDERVSGRGECDARAG